MEKNTKIVTLPPVSFLKTPTSNGTSRKVIVSRAATTARVEPSDKRGDISNEAVLVVGAGVGVRTAVGVATGVTRGVATTIGTLS